LSHIVLSQAQRTVLVGTHRIHGKSVKPGLNLVALGLFSQANPEVVLKRPIFYTTALHGLHGVIHAQQNFSNIVLQDSTVFVLALIGVLYAARYRAIGHGNVLNVVIKFAAFITPVGMGYEYMSAYLCALTRYFGLRDTHGADIIK